MTALNKTIRQQIIDSVIEKGTTLPARKEDLKKRTEQRVRELCLERVPKEFAAATKNLPQEWFPSLASEAMSPIVNPISIATMTDEQRRGMWRYPASFEPFKHPINCRFDRPSLKAGDYDARTNKPGPEKQDSWEYQLADLLKEAHQIAEDERKARDELRQFLASVNNYKQVLEKMPELEKHLPNYTKPMPLMVPVAPILKTLGKLGFDQSGEPVKRGRKEKAA